MIVKVAPIGEKVTEISVDSGSTVAQILAIAEVSENGRTISVNNVSATMDTAVTAENAVITLAGKMKGGQGNN
mgnify:CR=1 FL=1